MSNRENAKHWNSMNNPSPSKAATGIRNNAINNETGPSRAVSQIRNSLAAEIFETRGW
jgi:hypothetical protein